MKILTFCLALLLVSSCAGFAHRTNGPIAATGTMYFVFDMASETTVDGVLFARFVPDTDSLKHFPAVTSGSHPGEVTYISFEPAEAALEATLGRDEAQRVSHGTMPREIAVRVEVVVSDYKSEIECDSRVYYAKLTTVEAKAAAQVASQGQVPHGC